MQQLGLGSQIEEHAVKIMKGKQFNRIPKRKELCMYRTAALCLVLFLGFSLSAQTVNLTGKVTNQTGKGISGAVVALASKNLSATTDASGAYSLKGAVGVNSIMVLPGNEALSLNKGVVTVNLAQPAPVQIELFDIQGNLLQRVLDKPASAGNYQFDLMKQPFAANMMVIRVSIGQQTVSFRYFPFNNGKRTISSAAAPSTGQQLTKMQAIQDTLSATASRYATKKMAINSYEGTVDITLDTVNCTANPSKAVSAKATGSGPHQVVMETNSDAGINKGTIYRPTDIGPGKNYPIFLWGEGGCSQDGCSNQAAMGEFASWGYFIVADGTPGGCRSAMAKSSNATGGSMGDPKQFYGYLDWLFAQNKNPCSAYYQTLDTTKVAADGFSCGGLMSENASGDPRFTAIGITSSGLQSPNATLYGKIHTPFKIMNGGSGDMAYANGLRDYESISVLSSKIPIIYYSKTSAGHGGDLGTAKGDFNTVNLAWLNWQLKGDTGATGKALLIGSSCKFCTNSGWVFKSANIQ
jgi:hypothetical protein